MTDARQRWATPWWLIHWIRERTLEPIALDACAERETRKADLWYGPGSPWGENGLVGHWPDSGTIWVNPPYDDIGPWVARALHHIRLNCSRVVLLLPARTDQEWWHQLHVHSRARCCCLRPRVAFEAPAGVRQSSPSFATVLWEVTHGNHALPLVHVWR